MRVIETGPFESPRYIAQLPSFPRSWNIWRPRTHCCEERHETVEEAALCGAKRLADEAIEEWAVVPAKGVES